MPTSLSRATSEHRARSGSEHIWSYHLISCFGKAPWTVLEAIPGAVFDTSPLADRAPSPVTSRHPAAHPSLPPRSTSVATGSWARTCARTGAGSAGVTGAAACPWRGSSTALFLKEVGRQNDSAPLGSALCCCPDFTSGGGGAPTPTLGFGCRVLI